MIDTTFKLCIIGMCAYYVHKRVINKIDKDPTLKESYEKMKDSVEEFYYQVIR